ncbi:hypothetical protein CLOSTASPAR_04750 [[Clostridium] asparagiforme DSM 15981]|uniref:Uncharacterized protein n=1 Tax=[Clostridium] asparagiforme DSM 15981 TaxID=518636 RepID=C0D654_9FIRM|nr:hypothetical protein CLOSTASPAR_04750 [[Clostridium] asparagiforme DSM 15981]
MPYSFSSFLVFILFLLLLLYTKCCKIQRRFLQLFELHLNIFYYDSFYISFRWQVLHT